MSKNLTQYNLPADLKEMDNEQLELLSYSIRDFLIDNVSKTGGHIASNLGVVELTIGLHKVFDSPKDKIIWDVGHQSYVHKILTGRANQFNTLRQAGGMSGFPKGNESEHDIFDTGHSSTSLSVAAGFAAARDIEGLDYDVIAVIGDGSLTGGMAYEALNNIGASKSNIIVILNDNGMSISKNIGGVSQHLGKLRTSTNYIKAKSSIKKGLKKIPLVGTGISNNIGNAKERLKYALLTGGVIFEELGFTYLGPVDGHNLNDVIEILNFAKEVNGPVLIHTITKKGKGYRNAEIEPNKFHGIGPFDKETGIPLKSSGVSYSKIMGETLLDIAKDDDKIVAITAAMGDATGLGPFSSAYPKRFFDVGIAEAHGVTFAAGLAKAGMKPLVAIYSSFLQRGFDQIIEDVCLQNLPVVFAIDRAGLVGEDGETHQGIFDLSYLSTIPNMTILTPATDEDLRATLRYAFEQKGPVAIRYPRGNCVKGVKTDFYGKNKRINSGKNLDIWACGKMLHTAYQVQKLLLENNIEAGIVDVAIIKPLDLDEMANTPNLIVTIEDNVLTGGFGEFLNYKMPDKNVISFGWPDKFIEHGDCNTIFEKYGLDAYSIAERISEHFEREA